MSRRRSSGYFLDRMVRPTIHIHGHSPSSFLICGYTGLFLAIALATTLTAFQGMSLWVMGLLILSAMATFLTLAMVTKIITGEEQLIYYHHEIAVLVVAALILWALGEPVLAYIDAQLLGVGAFLACGRIGCLMVGCCHGIPHSWGVRYRQEHADAGFTPHLVGVRLLPIQLIESLYVLAIVAVGTIFILRGDPAGTAFAWYVVCYDVGRFFFEFYRGDPKRPYHGGFSEGQWISVILMVLLVVGEAAGILPFHAWHAAATAVLCLVMLLVALARRRSTLWLTLVNAYHVEEVAEALRLVRQPELQGAAESNGSDATVTPFIPLVCTSLGMRISGGDLATDHRGQAHYALSEEKKPMTKRVAAVMADLIVRLTGAEGRRELIKGNHEVFHLIVNKERDAVRQARSST